MQWAERWATPADFNSPWATEAEMQSAQRSAGLRVARSASGSSASAAGTLRATPADFKQSDDDRSSCSSDMFDEIIAGASGALSVQDLERGASSDSEGIVFDDSDGDGGDFCGLWKQKNSRRKQLEGKVRELESEVLEQLH